MGVLSTAQLAAARKAVDRHLDGVATVQRGTLTDTPTGKSTNNITVYFQIPCKLAPVSEKNPTTDASEGRESLPIIGLAWFPLEWPDSRDVVAPGAQPVPVPVVIERDDLIKIDGKTWRATTDQDPEQEGSPRVRVRVSRSHAAVAN